MKTVGLIGGISWESTVLSYRRVAAPLFDTALHAVAAVEHAMARATAHLPSEKCELRLTMRRS